jgi:hypothetical protein
MQRHDVHHEKLDQNDVDRSSKSPKTVDVSFQ